MLKHPKAFHVWMLLVAAFYWWLMDVWVSRWYLRLIVWLLGAKRFAGLEQQLSIRIYHTSRDWTVIYSLTTVAFIVFFCLAMIPVYAFWAFWYRRRDAYLEAMGRGTITSNQSLEPTAGRRTERLKDEL
jgi:hypothetical protein